jgi:hypothetical protein
MLSLYEQLNMLSLYAMRNDIKEVYSSKGFDIIFVGNLLPTFRTHLKCQFSVSSKNVITLNTANSYNSAKYYQYGRHIPQDTSPTSRNLSKCDIVRIRLRQTCSKLGKLYLRYVVRYVWWHRNTSLFLMWSNNNRIPSQHPRRRTLHERWRNSWSKLDHHLSRCEVYVPKIN